jgi:predicted metal-dependent phosphoesterase TrpH
MKFDLHIHTKFSYDSLSDIEAILCKAKESGLDGIAITDHDVFSSYDIPGLETKYGLWIIPGVELCTDIGDILGLFISNKINIKDSSKAIDEIHNQGGLAILAHPYKRIREYPIDVLKKLDAIEQVNSRWVDLQKHNDIKKVDMILSMVPGRTAGSDSHFVFEIGNAYLETTFLTYKNELREIISEGKGVPRYNKITSWLELLSQIVKFQKNPTARQAIRLPYYFLRELLSNNKRRRIS